MTGKNKPKYKRVAQIKSAEDFMAHSDSLGIEIPFEEEIEISKHSPQQQAYTLKTGKTIGNRFCILPMEGWDGTTDGRPSELTKRRWKNFALSGAKLLWGCEAVAVEESGRANPNQLMINEDTLDEFKELHQLVISTHKEHFGNVDDLLVGLQLTHSGRFCKPWDKSKMEPQILYHHPVLDKKFGLDDEYPLMADSDIDMLIEDYISAAEKAQHAGFEFVDIKHCHGYLGHEFLSAKDRSGKYGGSFENRTRFFRNIVEGIQARCPGLEIGVRLSAFDWAPFKKDQDEVGTSAWEKDEPYEYAFGGDQNGQKEELTETFKFLELCRSLNIELICISGGSPYYNPHIIRPALFPPSDGYLPPEDPMIGVARQIRITAAIKKQFPDLLIIGSAYSYLQEWLPNVAQAVLREEKADFVGLGRMVLSYPEMPADILNGTVLQRKKVCRTFSDCTTAPRNGIVSGCYPLDPYYKSMPEAQQVKALK